MQRSGTEGDAVEPGLEAASYTLHSPDSRLTVTVYCGQPAYIYVIHDGLTEGEIDAILIATAMITSCRCVLGNPRYRLRRTPKARTLCEMVPSISARRTYRFCPIHHSSFFMNQLPWHPSWIPNKADGSYNSWNKTRVSTRRRTCPSTLHKCKLSSRKFVSFRPKNSLKSKTLSTFYVNGMKSVF